MRRRRAQQPATPLLGPLRARPRPPPSIIDPWIYYGSAIWSRRPSNPSIVVEVSCTSVRSATPLIVIFFHISAAAGIRLEDLVPGTPVMFAIDTHLCRASTRLTP